MAKEATKKATSKRRSGASVDAMERYGIEGVCEAIVEGKSLRAIAAEAGASLTRLLAWIEADPERSARVRDSRAAMAKVWDEKAERGLEEAPDEFALRKAKELAHHYRWRAAKVAPREYGERISAELTGKDGGPIQSEDVTKRDADEFASRMLRLAAGAGAGQGAGEASGGGKG